MSKSNGKAIRDRVKGLKRVKASELSPHPQNWRKHPQAQQKALAAALAEVGYADALKVREHEGGYQIIDGHLRAGMTPDAKVPVLVLDLNDDETRKMLAVFDPLAALAETDDDMLRSLTEGIDFESGELGELMSDLMVPDFQPVDESEQGKLDEKAPVQCPECGHEFIA